MDDTLPPGVTWVSASTSQGTCDTHTVGSCVSVEHCDIDFMQPGDEETITIVVGVPSGTADNTTLTNSATVGGAVLDPVPSNNTTPDCNTTVHQPTASPVDVSVDKTCPATAVASGDSADNFSYQVTVTNGSDTDGATGVTLTDTLPDGVTFQSGTWPTGHTCSESGGVVTCNIGDLAADASVVVTITVLVDPAARGSITNTAVVSGNEGDPDTDNNTYQCASDVTGQVALQITKSDSPDPVITGNNLTYTIHVSNPNGPSDATNVQVVDTLPPGAVSFVSASPTQGSCINNGNVSVTCNLGTITPGDSATITIVVRVNNLALNPGACTAITNTATVKSDEDSTGKQATADTRVCAAPIGIPALTDWGMLILIMLAGVVSVIYLRRHRKA